MATYYKYAERQADSFVNWGEIGKNLSEMLQKENQLREDKKAAIDKASREFGEQLANAPTGEHQGANSWTLNYASEAQEARLLQDRLLKSGQLKLKDYTIMRQNINDGTKQVFNLSKEYQDEYKIKMERAKSQDPATASQTLEGFLMGTVEGFANFNKSKILINPTDFQLSVGMMEPGEDGVLKLTNNVETVNNLRNRIKSKFDKFDTQKATKEISGRMAEYIVADITRGSDFRAGQVVTLEDAMQRPGYKKSVVNAVNSYFTNPYNQLSVLTEDIGFDENGVPFTFTFDEKEAKENSNMVFLERDPQSGLPKGILTEKQKQATVDFMIGQIEQQIARKEEIRPFSEPQQSQFRSEAGGTVKEQEAVAGAWNQLYTGTTASEKQAAADILLGTPIAQKAGLLGIDMRTPGEIKLKYADAQKDRTIKYIDPSTGQPISIRNFSALGVELHNIVDIDKAMKAGGGGTEYGKIDDYFTIESKRAGQTPPAVKITIPLGGITEKSQNAVKILQRTLGTDFIVKEVGSNPLGNDIEITTKDGEETYPFTSRVSVTQAEVIKKNLEDWVQKHKGTARRGGAFANF